MSGAPGKNAVAGRLRKAAAEHLEAKGPLREWSEALAETGEAIVAEMRAAAEEAKAAVEGRAAALDLAREGAEAAAEAAQEGRERHDASPRAAGQAGASCMTLWTARTNASHPSVSRASCRRPAAVRV